MNVATMAGPDMGASFSGKRERSQKRDVSAGYGFGVCVFCAIVTFMMTNAQ